MNESLIRWKRSDYMKLSHAVRKFNKRIKELEIDELQYLPNMKDYQELKENILSRNELNRILNSLRKFSKEGQEKLVKTESGQEITKWEYSEIKKARTRAIRRLIIEKEEIEQGKKYLGMGDERLSQIEGTVESLKNIEKKKGFEFERAKERAFMQGSSDYNLKRAQTFRDNFMNSIEKLEGYDNADKLKNKLKNIKNPIQFYEFVRKSDTLFDLFLYYKDKATSQTYGGFASNQDAFNYALEELGIMIDE